MLDTFKITERKKAVLDLKKDKGIAGQMARVVLCLDFSYSMSGLYSNGTVQDTVERILPLGLAFDDNGEVDTYIFESGFHKLPENITLKNLDGYVNKKIVGQYSMGGTSYSPVIEDIIKVFGNKVVSTGWFSSSENVDVEEQPTYVIFITDGENGDHSLSERAMINASNHGIFFQFVGIGNEQFNFLQKLDSLRGRKIDNASFFKIADLNKISDSDLYNKLMTEFPDWLTAARKENLIK